MRALIIEDDYLIALDIGATLEDLGHTLCGVARNVPEALALSRTEQPDLLVADFKLDGPGTGVDAVRAVSAERPVKVIYVTGNGDHVRAADSNAPVLEKPVDSKKLAATVQRILNE